jgi:hypothetical protein
VPGPTPVQTFHWDGRQTSWIAPATRARPRPERASSTTARLFLTGIEVEAPPARSVVVIGDSITDGATASLDQDQRWTDHLAARLAPRGVAVVNAGISGGRLLRRHGRVRSGPLPARRTGSARRGQRDRADRHQRHQLARHRLRPAQARPTLAELQAGYRALAEQAHRRGLRILGATLMPFAGALPGTPLDDYYHPDKDALRQQLNAWLRTTARSTR